MAEAAALPQPIDRSFLWRRLHSLSGIVPIGGFLCFHIFENMAALQGPAAYNATVLKINEMLPKPFFYGVEILVLIVPILFHAFYGAYIAARGQSNVGKYAYRNNWAYLTQRITGWVAFAYLILHVGVLRFGVSLAGHHFAAVSAAGPVTFQDVAAVLGNRADLMVHSALAGNWVFVAYIIGTLFTIFHFTNGLKGFCWTWGIAVGPRAQAKVMVVGWILFVLLAVATLAILFTMRFGAF